MRTRGTTLPIAVAALAWGCAGVLLTPVPTLAQLVERDFENPGFAALRAEPPSALPTSRPTREPAPSRLRSWLRLPSWRSTSTPAPAPALLPPHPSGLPPAAAPAAPAPPPSLVPPPPAASLLPPLPIRPVAAPEDDGPAATLLPPARTFQRTTWAEPVEQLPAPRKAPSAEADILLGAARTAVRRQDWDTALARFEDYFRRYGDDLRVRGEYAGVLVQAGQVTRAVREYEGLVRAKPNDRELLVTYGDVLVTAKQYARAATAYQQALNLAPDKPEVAVRLARAYVFDGDPVRALEVYERHLGRLRPGDENAPDNLPALLLDLNRPEDALVFLAEMRTASADDPDLIALLVRAHAQQADTARVAAALRELTAKAPRDVAVRRTLADTLFLSGDFENAALVYQQILTIEPGNPAATVGLARVELLRYQPRAACALLTATKPDAATERLWKLTWGEYHQLVGEHRDAAQTYLDFLARDPADHEARLALGLVYEYVRELEKAKAEFCKVPADSGLSRQARMGTLLVHISGRRYNDAVALARRLIAERPGDGSAMAGLVRALGKAKEFAEAESLARAYLDRYRKNVSGSQTVREALARALLDGGRPADAEREYQTVLARPAGRTASTYYGLIRAAEKLECPERARVLLAEALRLPGGEARVRLQLSEEYTADFLDPPAIRLSQSVLEADPQNLAALIRLGDNQQRQARFTADITELLQTCKTVLALSPRNVRALIGQARGFATVAHYPEAVREYERLLALWPTFTVAARERARVLGSDKQFDAARAAFAELEQPPADVELRTRLSALLERHPEARAVLTPYLQAGLAPGQLQACLPLIAGAGGEVEAELRRLLCDHEARCREQELARVEGEAKDLKGVRDREAIPRFQALVEMEPSNAGALFDLGQTFASLKRTGAELDAYGAALVVDPLLREAMVASERAGLELRPQLRSGYEFFEQRGRSSLARIQTHRGYTTLVVPCGDEEDWASVGYARLLYVPFDDRSLEGNQYSAALQKRWSDRFLTFARLNYEDFGSRIQDRPTFEVRSAYDWSDCLRLRAEGFLENVVENGNTLRQSLYRTGLRLGADGKSGRHWEYGASYDAVYYSDVNYLNHVRLYDGYSITLPPKQLRLVASADYYGFSHPTVVFAPGPDGRSFILHPYFAPENFVYSELRVQWTHWLSRDTFVHANVCWYNLEYGIGFDSRFASYHNFRAALNYDVRPWLTLGAEARATRSADYDSFGAVGTLTIRFPCCR